MENNARVQTNKQKIILTVLLAKFLTMHVRYAELPTKAVTFLGVIGSKCGSYFDNIGLVVAPGSALASPDP